MSSYTLHCQCPTPLVVNPMTVEAGSEDEAKAMFFEANGITGTDHPIEIQKAEQKAARKGKVKDEPIANTADDQG